MSELVERYFQISISEIGFRLDTVSLRALYHDRVRTEISTSQVEKMDELVEWDFQISISENDFVPLSEKDENFGFMLVQVDGEVTTEI